jgi:phosphate transport system substrate-binding protein
MKLGYSYLIGVCSLLLTVFVLMPSGSILAKEVLRYSCSAQVYEAFENERLDALTKKTGIEVELSILSSYKAFFRLKKGYSDIASMARRLYRRHRGSGFAVTPFCKDPMAVIINVQFAVTPFCKDPMAVIVNPQCPITDLSGTQLCDIFGGAITNWKEVGGPDRPIIVILPSEETAAYRNFSLKVMFSREMVSRSCSPERWFLISRLKGLPWSLKLQGVFHGPFPLSHRGPQDTARKMSGLAR